MIKIGLDWCLRNRPKKPEFVERIMEIRRRMSVLDQIDWKKKPEAKKEYYELQKQLATLEIVPEETVGMRRLKELTDDEKRKAFDKYALPRIRDAQKGDGNESYIKHWKDMTFEKWTKESKNSFLEDEMPDAMKDIPRAFGPFVMMAGWMSFRGKCIGYCDLISSDLQERAYGDMTPEQMLSYATELEVFAKKWKEAKSDLLKELNSNKEKLNDWEKNNDWIITVAMDDSQRQEHKNKMRKKYGDDFIGFTKKLNESGYYDYRNLVHAIHWLRFWGRKGHGMHAWY